MNQIALFFGFFYRLFFSKGLKRLLKKHKGKTVTIHAGGRNFHAVIMGVGDDYVIIGDSAIPIHAIRYVTGISSHD